MIAFCADCVRYYRCRSHGTGLCWSNVCVEFIDSHDVDRYLAHLAALAMADEMEVVCEVH